MALHVTMEQAIGCRANKCFEAEPWRVNASDVAEELAREELRIK